ncbi:MAG: MATE family efflux transporter [Planctomycetota bacterium]|nr:MAG: MATE family efflux transporter [Planctomycetota bacterium]
MADESGLLQQEHAVEETSLKYMLKLAGPMIITTISFTIMQFVDRLMVSRLGTEALAAILPAGFISFIPASFVVGVYASIATFVSQSLGKGETKDCSSYWWQAIYMGLAYSAVVLAIMWPAAPWVFRLLGHEPEVVGMEVIYLRIMLYANAVGVFVWASNQFFMGIHRPIIMMYAALVGQVVNVAANYILIFGKLGFPAMGIEGAGWGTFVGIAVGAGIRMAMFLGGDVNRNFQSRQTTKLDLGKVGDLLKVGLPAGVELMLNVAFWGAILFWLVGKFGKEALAATSAVLSCTHVSIMPVVGLKIALSAAVGKSIGGDRKDVAVKQTGVCLRVALIYMGLVGLCFFIFREALMGVWSSDDKVIGIGVNILICAAIYQVFHAARTIYSGSLRGAGDTLWLAIASALGAVVVLGLGGLFIVEFLPGLGSLGPWIAATLSIITVGLANRWRFKSNSWMQIDLFKSRRVGVPVENGAVVE